MKIDHEAIAAEDELEGFWSSAFVQGSPLKIMYDGQSLLDVLLTSTLPLLIFRGVLSLKAEKTRFWRLENEDARVKTPFVRWRHRPTVKGVRLLPLILHQSVHLCCGKVREHGELFFALNCRHVFSHSVKEHPYFSRYRINTLVAYWIFFAVSFI